MIEVLLLGCWLCVVCLAGAVAAKLSDFIKH